MTVLPFSSRADVDSALQRVADHLDQRGLIAYPTETVYGLGSHVQDTGLKALCDLTERPKGKPFLMLIAGLDMAARCGLSFSEAALRLAKRFWPGPLTLVLSGQESDLPDLLRGNDGGIAVRWSSHHNTSRLIEGLGFPLSSTSANRSGKDPLPDIDAIRAEFADSVSSGQLLLLNGGPLKGSLPSTLVDCTGEKPRILRIGALSSARVTECVSEVCG